MIFFGTINSIDASKLEPIIFFSLSISIALVTTFLIFITSLHLAPRFLSHHFVSVLGNVLKCMLSLLLKLSDNQASSAVKQRIGANHAVKNSNIIFKVDLQDFLFLLVFSSQYKQSYLISK